MPKPLPDAGYLRDRLSYSPQTGILTWQERPLHQFPNTRACSTWNARYSGKNAGYIDPAGRIFVAIEHVRYLAHRIIWKMQTGTEPAEIDHRDGDPGNNRWSNLRLGERRENLWNRVLAPGNLPRGVKRRGRRFRARMTVNRQDICLGTYDTPEEAHEAWCAAARKERGEFFRAD